MHLTCNDLIVTTTRDHANLFHSFRTISNKKPSLMSQTFTTPSSAPMTKKRQSGVDAQFIHQTRENFDAQIAANQ